MHAPLQPPAGNRDQVTGQARRLGAVCAGVARNGRILTDRSGATRTGEERCSLRSHAPRISKSTAKAELVLRLHAKATSELTL